MSDNLRFSKWDRWLEKIKDEVTNLVVHRYIFWEVQKIIEANPKIQKPSSFYAWMGNVYVTDAVMGVRKQLDNREDSISLARLLNEIIQTPSVLSRERIMRIYLKDPNSDEEKRFLERIGRRDFDKFAGVGNNHVDSKLVEEDLLRLQDIGRKIKNYGNKRVAHLDRSGLKHLPTFNELNASIDCIEKLLKKYLLLFRAVSYKTLPVWQYDWKAIFTETWAPKTRRVS